jgi:carboxynorspermidine decarboxylase
VIDLTKIPSPCYVIEEELLRNNLQLIRSVKDRTGIDIILAFKAFAVWKSFPVFREYGIDSSTASSVNEARLAFEEMGSPAHAYSPSYTDEDFPLYLQYSSHITFNSLSQFCQFYPQVVASGKKIKCGLRINPEFSVVTTALYDPSSPGSRLGITADQLGDKLPNGISGLHLHNLCENNSYALEETLQVTEQKFGHFFFANRMAESRRRTSDDA